MNEIYYCKRIWKDRDYDIEKGDIGWISDAELPELVGRGRILLSDVVNWKEFKSTNPFYKNTEEKIRIYSKEGPTIIIIQKLEEFDKVMELYISSKQQFNFN